MMDPRTSRVILPDLCGGSWSSPGRPYPHWRPHTCSATCPETNCLSWLAGSRRDSRSPWTRTPDRGENAGCTRRRAEPASGVTASCQRSEMCSARSVIEQHDGNELRTAFTSWLWPPPAVRIPTCTPPWPFSPPPSSPSIDLPAQGRTGHCLSPDPGSLHRAPAPTELRDRRLLL